MTDDRRLTDEQARRLWQRAAELQAQAARSLEQRSEGLVRRDDEVDDETADPGYALTHVRQAALEAGISAEFIDLAIQESDADGGEEEKRWVRRVVGEGPRWISASRVYDHPASTIFASMERVFPGLRLKLVDTRGEPLEGGRMVFELPSVGMQETDRLMIDLYHWADVRELHIRLEPVDDDRCQVTVRAPLRYARKLGGWVTAGLSPVGGMLAALLTGAIVSSVTGGLALAPAMQALLPWLSAAGAFGAGTAGSVKGLRVLTRKGWKRGEDALERLLGSLDIDARTGGAFRPAPAPPSSGLSIPGFLDA